MSAPTLVLQPERKGCGPACLAMLTGGSYERAKVTLGRARFTSEGLSRKAMDEALAREGYAVRRVFGAPGPFADVHLVETISTEPGWHWVVMLGDGAILDPAPTAATYLLPTYEAYRPLIRCVAGVYRVGQ